MPVWRPPRGGASFWVMPEPWTEEQARWVVQRAATLAKAGAEPVGPIVLPTGRFFPDSFDRTPQAIGKLFDRMKEHVGLDDLETEVLLVDQEAGAVVSSCSGGSCGGGGVKVLAGERIAADGDGYAVQIATAEVTHPVVLTTVMARSLGLIFLDVSGVARRFSKAEVGPAADLAASMLGLGVLIANGSGIEVKGCGGIKVHAATSLAAPQTALALALVVEREIARGRAEPEGLEAGLDVVARASFAPARAMFRANRDVIRRLDDSPDALERGDFRLKSGLGLGERVLTTLGFKKAPVDPIAELERDLAAGRTTRKAMDPAKKARLAELEALYDEVRSEPPGGSPTA